MNNEETNLSAACRATVRTLLQLPRLSCIPAAVQIYCTSVCACILIIISVSCVCVCVCVSQWTPSEKVTCNRSVAFCSTSCNKTYIFSLTDSAQRDSECVKRCFCATTRAHSALIRRTLSVNVNNQDYRLICLA